MIVVERTFTVAAAPAPVLGYLADFANTPQWDPAACSTTRRDAGPPAPGSSWHHVCKVFGVTAELTYTLVTREPGRLVFHGRNEGATCVDSVWLRACGGGTEVTFRVELEMHGLAKLATPVLKVEFEKLGAEGFARLRTVLDTLAPPRTAEVRFEIPSRNPAVREAEA
jgi:carbon monoxide dehydrogenase subunit G